jgi:Flp pilus assembly protein TadD
VAKLTWSSSSESKEAISFAQKAVELEPGRVEYRVQLARMLDSAGMKALAKRQFEKVLEMDPKNAEAKKHIKGRWPF